MNYCPYCSSAITKDVNICPHCKKNINLDQLETLFQAGPSSHVNTGAVRKMWLKENSRIIYPVITLLIGFIAGAVLLYMYAQLQFINERASYKEKISGLENQIQQHESSAGDVKKTLEESIESRDDVIKILVEQKKLMSNIINFTRRLASNSTITPNSPNETNYYQRNFRYLNRLYDAEKEKLTAAKFEPVLNPNLQTVPQLLEN